MNDAQFKEIMGYLELLDGRISLLAKNVYVMQTPKREKRKQEEDLFVRFKKENPLLPMVQKYIPDLVESGNYFKGQCCTCMADGSFTVSPKKNIYYCFRCHQGGDQISFFCKMKGITVEQFVKQQTILQED